MIRGKTRVTRRGKKVSRFGGHAGMRSGKHKRNKVRTNDLSRSLLLNVERPTGRSETAKGPVSDAMDEDQNGHL